MKKFWNLFVDEMNRSKHFFVSFVMILLIAEGLSFVRMIKFQGVFQPQKDFGLENLFAENNLFWMIVAVGLAVTILYVHYIWFREWHLQGRFIYRLLSLPGSRLAISWAKWSASMLMSLTMIVIQWLVFIIVDQLCQALFDNYISMGWRLELLNLTPLNVLIPLNLKGFAFIALLISLVILISSNLQILFNSLKQQSMKRSISLTGIYLILSILLIVFAIWLDSVVFHLTDRETFVWLIWQLLFINLLQGLWMSFISQRVISI
ncbi:hypothetical protein ACWOA0_00185 [Ignavigranum ruoffiae]|uniref:ABC-2 family transporter protein n=1 Tax=Ignavigranum ruoffiae TaxID=89093 RepID=A0A1H9A2V7_9LACT|nr:hypothetical protein [Ignavigranum ruoffiae]UPQ85719.1 hypothetical protein M0R79_08720 [Ignavigranum ruoffiae]SEP70999.1 hypothetical protein SAMN04488558_101403 [Ignavigranum ruoffiae]